MSLIGILPNGAYYLADTSRQRTVFMVPDEACQLYLLESGWHNGHRLSPEEWEYLKGRYSFEYTHSFPSIRQPPGLQPESINRAPGNAQAEKKNPVPQNERQSNGSIKTEISYKMEKVLRLNRYERFLGVLNGMLPMFEWQKKAYAAWEAAGFIGVVEAATGTGKTRLAMEAIARFGCEGYRITVLVPTIVILEQWVRELKRIFKDLLRIGRFDGTRKDSFLGHDIIVACVNSACKNAIQALGNDRKTFLIADEVHHYGSRVFAKSLVEQYAIRLSLTATYSRRDTGVGKVLDPYFKSVCFRYTLLEASKDGVVAPYDLIYHRVFFSPSARNRYDDLQRHIGKSLFSLEHLFHIRIKPFHEFFDTVVKISNIPEHPAHKLAKKFIFCFSERKKMLSEGNEKFDVLKIFESRIQESEKVLIFSVTKNAAERSSKELEKLGFSSQPVHSGLTRDQRTYILDGFRRGRIKVLCAPLVLDEGIDVPSADLAIILAAHQSERQFIQRVGRVLRKKKDGRKAGIIIVYYENTMEDPMNSSMAVCYRGIEEGADQVFRNGNCVNVRTGTIDSMGFSSRTLSGARLIKRNTKTSK